MKKVMAVLMMCMVAGFANAAFVETFDDFTLGGWVDQQGWSQLSGDPSTVIDSTIGYTVDGCAIRHQNSMQSKTYRLNDGVNVGIDSTASVVQLSFDFLSEGWGISNAVARFRLDGYTSSLDNPSPSFGINSGAVALRPDGETGTIITGTNLAGLRNVSWSDKDWLRFTLTLEGDNLQYATISILDLNTNQEIDSGINNYDLGRNMRASVQYWETHLVRPAQIMNGYANVVFDNLSVTAVPEPATLALLGLGGLLLRKRRA